MFLLTSNIVMLFWIYSGFCSSKFFARINQYTQHFWFLDRSFEVAWWCRWCQNRRRSVYFCILYASFYPIFITALPALVLRDWQYYHPAFRLKWVAKSIVVSTIVNKKHTERYKLGQSHIHYSHYIMFNDQIIEHNCAAGSCKQQAVITCVPT